MKLIACVDKNWAIGSNGNLLFKLPEDMRFFKQITTDCGIVIMGRKTFESLKSEDGLKGRENWVLTRDKDYQKKYPNIKVFHSKDDIFRSPDYDRNKICIIGGTQIYKQFLSACDEAYITLVSDSGKDPDTFFPKNLDNSKSWELEYSYQGSECVRIGINYKFNKYRNILLEV